MTVLGKLRTATLLASRGEFTELLARAIVNYNQTIHVDRQPVAFLTILPLVLLNEVHLLLDERAIAYPTRNNSWQLVTVPRMRPLRELPVLSAITANGTRHGSASHVEHMSKYIDQGFTEIRPGDTVVDVGAFVGSFTIYAVGQGAETVIAIDPNASMSGVLARNTASYPGVTVVPKAAWNATGTIEVQQSLYPTENSVLTPDSHPLEESFVLPADTVPNIVRDEGVDHVDFLKIEAEGVEPEILTGALDDDLPIDRIAVDAGAERYGESVTDDVIALLSDHGYDYRQDDETATIYASRKH